MDALIKREKAEYSREGIAFSHIEYPDNTAQVRKQPPLASSYFTTPASPLPCLPTP